MHVSIKNLSYSLFFNSFLFLFLFIGIQNSSIKEKVNFIKINTVSLPISFIIGVSFIAGSFTGSLLSLNLGTKKKQSS